MRPTLFASVLPFDEARRRVLEAVHPITRTEVVVLADADGRVAAADVTSPIDVPPFDRAAMDGYAVIAEDTRGATPDAPRTLVRTGAVFTGEWPDRPVGRGDCVEIATGAPMPDGADAVVMVEATRADAGAIVIAAAVQPGQNIGRQGADLPKGSAVIRAGDVLTPSRVGALAAIGQTTMLVYQRPSAAILSTGNEVIEPGSPIRPGQIYDINRFTLEAVTRRHGGAPFHIPIAADSPDALASALDAASHCDLAVFSGGSSVGGRDLLSDALAAKGEIIFHGIAVKPGKPTLFGRIGRTLVFGMPGYPASCLSNAYMLLVPALRIAAGLPPWRPDRMTLPLSARISSTPDRHQFYTVRIVNGSAEPAFKASGDITSMARADGFIEIPVGVDHLDAGTEVTVTIF